MSLDRYREKRSSRREVKSRGGCGLEIDDVGRRVSLDWEGRGRFGFGCALVRIFSAGTSPFLSFSLSSTPNMLSSFRLSLVLGIVAAQLANGFQCPDEPLVSCSEDLRHEEEISSCCVSHPAGPFSYTQTWDSEEGKWLAGHLRLLK